MVKDASFIDEDYVDLFAIVSKMVKNKKVTADNVVYLAGVIMEEVEKQNSMNGYDKKQFVVNALKEIVRLSKYIPDDQKPVTYLAIQMLVPGAIDLIVAGASGDLAINIPTSNSCFSCFKKEDPPKTAAKQLFNKKVK